MIPRIFVERNWMMLLSIIITILWSVNGQIQSVTDAYGESSELMKAHELKDIMSGIQGLASPKSKYYDATAPGVERTVNHTLSDTCSNQYCDMLVTALSCKAIGIHLEKICASYFVGTVTGCAGYPSQFYDAPYYCALQIGTLLKELGVGNNLQNLKKSTESEAYQPDSMNNEHDIRNVEVGIASVNQHYVQDMLSYHNAVSQVGGLPFNPANISLNGTVLNHYLKGNMSLNCQRNCYQNYINQGNILFAGSCRSEVYNPNNQANYKFLKLLSTYQTLRNQVCVENPTPTPGIHANCYDALMALSGSSSSSASKISDSILFSMTCEYNLGAPDYLVQGQLALGIAKVGCCFGNILAMLTQDPLSLPPLIFPPCLLRYMNVNAKTVSPSTYCTFRANGNMTVFEFNMNITNSGGGVPPVDVYDSTSLLTFQGIVIKILTLDPTIVSTLPPYALNPKIPLQPEVINYLYYKDDVLLTPVNGHTDITDFTTADRVALTVLLSFEGLTTPEELLSVSTFIEGANFPFYMGLAFTQVYHQTYAVTVGTANHPVSRQYIAEPIQLSAASSSHHSYVIVLGVVSVAILSMLML